MTQVVPTPIPADPASADLRHASLYLNRELSWLEFNRRVLHEAQDSRTPVLERLKFLVIFSSNLDEFFQVRVAGLKQQLAAGIVERTADGMTPEAQLRAISATVRGSSRTPPSTCHQAAVRPPSAARSWATSMSRPLSRKVSRTRSVSSSPASVCGGASGQRSRGGTAAARASAALTGRPAPP